MIIIGYKTNNIGVQQDRLDSVEIFDQSEEKSKDIIWYIGLIVLICGIRKLNIVMTRNLAFLIHNEWDSHFPPGFNGFEKFIVRIISICIILYKLMFMENVISYALFVLFAVLGLLVHPFFYAYHTIIFKMKFSGLNYYFQSIINQIQGLIAGLILYCMLCYMYS